MRINTPVTQHQYRLRPDQTLVSVTDLKGRITYCNPSFIEASGFDQNELLGQAHNLVRHPDMPSEAFRDMWATLQLGRPWTGLVKNRRKNGDYYWVRANATPMMDGQRISGYLSVRTCPAQDEINATEQLYARMRAEQERGQRQLQLRHGALHRSDLAGRLRQCLRLGVSGRLALIQAGAIAAPLAAAAAGLPPLAGVAIALAAAATALQLNRQLTLLPLKGLLRDANHLAAGDLSHRVRTGAPGEAGQLQQALNQMSLNLRAVVRDVRQEIGNVQEGMRDIAEGNQNMAARTEAQASNLEQTAASMHQINGAVQHSADAAAHGAQLARDTAAMTTRSNAAVESAAATMRDIADSSHRIKDIVSLIEGVAFQTNILALNAAVEAARAGDAGRGFAVVATEVRALAQRTTSAARDIQGLINESSERVVRGTTETDAALERMGEALAAVGQVREVLDGLQQASAEQTSGIAQIDAAVVHMDDITQKNAAMVEELAMASTSLRQQVEQVSNSMRLFRLTAADVTLAQSDAVALRRMARPALAAGAAI